MVCVPCVLVPLLLFLWGLIKPMLNWFKKPVENTGGEQTNTVEDPVCSLLSSCPCINQNKQLPEDQTNESVTLLKEPLETPIVDKKNI